MAVAAWEVQSPAHQCASKMRLQIASTAKRGPRPSVLVLASMLHVILGSNREVGAHPSFDSHTVTALMQARDAGVVRVAKLDDSFSVANVTGVSGEPAKLAILISEKLLTAAENQRLGEFVFLKFNGLPEELNFSAGFRSKDAWLVSIKDASGLELLSPPDYAGLIPEGAGASNGASCADCRAGCAGEEGRSPAASAVGPPSGKSDRRAGGRSVFARPGGNVFPEW
jgi:hypothetical protein